MSETSTYPDRPEYKQKAIRSFVIRAGRMTDAQKSAFARHWPTYGLSLFGGPLDTQQRFGREAPLVLEIGFDMGDSLLEMALAEPDKDFIGIEVHPPGVGRLLNAAAEAEVSNLKLYMADAKDVLADCIPAATLDRLQVYFPDPWHKKKHHKRRIIQPDFIQAIAPSLKAGGLLHLATDWAEYAEHMLEVMEAAEGFANTSAGFTQRPSFRPITKFEKRGERLGHSVWDLLFQRD